MSSNPNGTVSIVDRNLERFYPPDLKDGTIFQIEAYWPVFLKVRKGQYVALNAPSNSPFLPASFDDGTKMLVSKILGVLKAESSST